MTVVDFTHIWNTIPFPAFVINSNLNIIEGNSAAEQIVHTSQSHMIGKNLGLFFGKNSGNQALKKIQKIKMNPGQCYKLKIVIIQRIVPLTKLEKVLI